ncbi:MAG: DUF6078 family protein [Bacteroidales bacterium]
MPTQLDYTQPPSDFIYCFRADCSKANVCLRHLMLANIKAEQAHIHSMNPSYRC